MHRGRRLVDVPEGAKSACGHKKSFVCGFHGWTYDQEGDCIHIPEQGDWQGALTPENTHLAQVNVDTWGGWIWINMDPDREPLRDYLEPAATMLDPFRLQNMRCRWRKWLHFDCNWKVAMEAFNETYHVATTHPEFNKFGDFRGWATAQGKHSNIGYDAPKDLEETKSKIRLGTGADPRVSTAEMQLYTLEETNATTTKTLVDAAVRLVDELPEGRPGRQGARTLARIRAARRCRAGRGLADHRSRTPGQQRHRLADLSELPDRARTYHRPVLQRPPVRLRPGSSASSRPPATSCIRKAQEPQTEWVYTPLEDPDWRSVLPQDFSNMAAVQQGMKSVGFRGPKPNPYLERSTANLHRNLAEYMGTGAPRDLATETEFQP